MLKHPAITLIAAGLLALGLTVFAACGGGGGSDEDQIRDLVNETMNALEDLDAEKIANLTSEECNADPEEIKGALALLILFGDGELPEVDVDDVEITNLADGKADVRVTGTLKFAGEEQPLDEEGDASPVVKEDGTWRWADCSEWGSGTE